MRKNWFVSPTGEWQIGINDPSPLGVLATAGYALTVFLCFRAALKSRAESSKAFTTWTIIAMGLLLLGINKQLDLQVWLRNTGRSLAETWDFYQQRRLLQKIFLAAFAVALLGLTAGFAFTARSFFRRHPLAFWGLVLLALFILLRAASAEHVGFWDSISAGRNGAGGSSWEGWSVYRLPLGESKARCRTGSRSDTPRSFTS
jgi:hypothetical protein